MRSYHYDIGSVLYTIAYQGSDCAFALRSTLFEAYL
jgi:hypothetical protein